VYQMLAGVLPFTGADTTEVLRDIVNRDPPHVDGQRSDTANTDFGFRTS
jgi:hypothetical protein